MKRKSEIIDFNGQELVVKELTVAEVEQIMAALEDGTYQGHILDAVMGQPLPANALFMAIGTTEAEFSLDVAPSALEELYAKVTAVNPLCAAMMEKLATAGARRLQSGPLPAS